MLQLLHLRDAAGKNDKAAESARQELRTTRKRMEELNAQLTRLTSEVSTSHYICNFVFNVLLISLDCIHCT